MSRADVIVLGGGPAGASASLLLASWGHTVRVITKAGVDHRLAVSLPPSTAKLFSALGVADAIEQAAFLRSSGNTVWWGASDKRIERFADGAYGWQVDVGTLADVIMRRAQSAGVIVDRRTITDPPVGFVLDCTGRAGIVARIKDVRRPAASSRTVAMIGEWRCQAGWPVPDNSHTLIESYDDGWMWSVPVGRGVRHIAAMVDPQRSGLAKERAPREIYLREIAKTREFKRLTATAAIEDGPWGWDASQYDATRYADEEWMLVGDAGSFVDPLSSAGVKKALASGWLAAVVAHTCLKSPSMKAHAFAFFNEREREIAEHLHRESARFLADAAAGHQRPFWDERQVDEAVDVVAEAEIQHAFDRLKRAESIRLQISPAISIDARPIIRGNELVLEPHISEPGTREAVRYVSGVDIVALLELAPEARQVPDLHAAYENRLGPTPLSGFLHALATALARGWLVSQ